MSLAIVRTARAKRDLAELADYLAQDRLELALRFLDAAEAAFDQLAGRRRWEACLNPPIRS